MQQHPEPDMDDLAGPLDRRAEAVLIDGILILLATLGVGYLLGAVFVGGSTAGLGVAILATMVLPVVHLVYFTLMEAYYGQTLGKRIRGIVVVSKDGSKITTSGAVIRNVIRFVDTLPTFYIIGIAVASMNDANQRFGDIVGRTVVAKTAE